MRDIFAVLVLVGAAIGYYFYTANDTSAEQDTRFATYSESSEQVVDHDEWQLILDDYLVSDTDSGVNLFDYSGLIDDGREPLDQYVDSLTAIDPLGLNRHEQMSYWLNLYNALTVQLIINHFPTASITTLGSNPLEFGPWNEVAANVNGVDLSLNDIEHRIIRPLYDDYRIHFAVNCASIGCPNLAVDAFTAENLDDQLDEAASEYLNHPRGVRFEGEQLHLSSLFDWYADDFGDNQQAVLATLSNHTDPSVTEALTGFSGDPVYYYDWGLNGYCSIDNACGPQAE